ncbi:MAG TPA: hypothetical protein VF598_00320 [Hymenobacter sp.]
MFTADHHVRYQADFATKQLGRLRAIIARLSADADAVDCAQHEGILDVTIRTTTRAITVAITPAAGPQIATELLEGLLDRIQALEQQLLAQLVDAGHEAARVLDAAHEAALTQRQAKAA